MPPGPADDAGKLAVVDGELVAASPPGGADIGAEDAAGLPRAVPGPAAEEEVGLTGGGSVLCAHAAGASKRPPQTPGSAANK